MIKVNNETLRQIIKERIDKVIANGLIYIDVSDLDTSAVTDFTYLFKNTKGITRVIGMSNWSVFRVQTTEGMLLRSAIKDIGNISRWKFRKLMFCNAMFKDSAVKYAGKLSRWIMPEIIDSGFMFDDCPLARKFKVSEDGKKVLSTYDKHKKKIDYKGILQGMIATPIGHIKNQELLG